MQSHSLLLRSRAAQSTVIPDVPHVPLQDDWYAYQDMFVLRDSYEDPLSEAVRRDREGIMRGGGYRVEEAWERALRSAVAGLEIQPLVGLDPPVSLSESDVVMAPA
jgi:CDK-activating kinase assembly factor MAT1